MAHLSITVLVQTSGHMQVRLCLDHCIHAGRQAPSCLKWLRLHHRRDDGVGLAAPQVGVNVRLMVFNEAGVKGKGEEVGACCCCCCSRWCCRCRCCPPL